VSAGADLLESNPGSVTTRWVSPLRQCLEPRYMSGIVWLRYVSQLATGLFGSAMRACISGSAIPFACEPRRSPRTLVSPGNGEGRQINGA
jgi:hypothetical protein